MTPSWKFRDVKQVIRSRGSSYTRPWPEDIPEKCGVCGTRFIHGFNLSVGPGKVGRVLRRIAYFGFLPFLLLGGFVLPVLLPEFFKSLRDNHQSWAVLGMMFFPSLIFGILSVLMPVSRRVQCKKCGWLRDYKLPKPVSLTPSP